MRRVLAVAALIFAAPAHAEVVSSSPAGFALRESTEVTADPEAVWQQLLRPAQWWSPTHTYSGDAANLSLDAMAAGCFCEILPNATSPRAAPRGSVAHMMVVYAEQGRALRMTGGLGPLQAEGLYGALTITLKPLEGGGTRIGWEYVVGGYMRYTPEQIAPAVDRVLAEQATRLAAKLGPKNPASRGESAGPPAPTPPPARRAPAETGR